MSEIKRYELGFRVRGGWYDEPCMEEDDTGDYVLHSDYSSVVAQRDELARAVAAWGANHCACPKFKNWSDGQEKLPHRTGCPVALAEKIVKEAGDGR